MDTLLELAAAEEVSRGSVGDYQQLLPFPTLTPATPGACNVRGLECLGLE